MSHFGESERNHCSPARGSQFGRNWEAWNLFWRIFNLFFKEIKELLISFEQTCPRAFCDSPRSCAGTPPAFGKIATTMTMVGGRQFWGRETGDWETDWLGDRTLIKGIMAEAAWMIGNPRSVGCLVKATIALRLFQNSPKGQGWAKGPSSRHG